MNYHATDSWRGLGWWWEAELTGPNPRLFSPASLQIIIAIAGDGLSSQQLKGIGLVRMIRLLRLGRLLRVVEQFKAGLFIRLVKLLAFIVLVVHWMTCFWFFLFQMLYSSVGEPWSFNEQVTPDSAVITYFLTA